jgi:hypothetical protein
MAVSNQRKWQLSITLTISQIDSYNQRVTGSTDITSKKEVTANTFSDIGIILDQLDRVGLNLPNL